MLAVQEIREVLERIGAAIADDSDEAIVYHATHAMRHLADACDDVDTVWKVTGPKTLHEMLRAIADISEIVETYGTKDDNGSHLQD